MASLTQASERKGFSYNYVDGLKEIIIAVGPQTPQASFIFETAEKANAAYKNYVLIRSIADGYGLTGRKHTDYENTSLLETLGVNGLSKGDTVGSVIAVQAKTLGTAGRPIETVGELLNKMGDAMRTGVSFHEVEIKAEHLKY